MTSHLSSLECGHCSATYSVNQVHGSCRCGGTLLARYDVAGIDFGAVQRRQPGLWRYRELLPVQEDPVSLGEPETPLLPAATLSQRVGVEIYVKDDGFLPGGTFKARGAAVAVSRARELGVQRIVMPSAGNAGGAWALYTARAGIQLHVTMSRAAPKVNQDEVTVAGATLELVEGTISDAGRRAAEIASKDGTLLAATFQEPYRLEGKKTAWFETFERLGDGGGMRLPGTIVVPVGGGVAALAATKAAQEVTELEWAQGPQPVIIGVQPARCAPIARAFELGLAEVDPWVDDPDTIAAGLRVPAPREGALVLDAVRASGGAVVTVSDDEMRDAMATLAADEGILACPEGAATLPALERVARSHGCREPVVLYNTGTGVKYPHLWTTEESLLHHRRR